MEGGGAVRRHPSPRTLLPLNPAIIGSLEHYVVVVIVVVVVVVVVVVIVVLVVVVAPSPNNILTCTHAGGFLSHMCDPGLAASPSPLHCLRLRLRSVPPHS